jgi:hypothetical protein
MLRVGSVNLTEEVSKELYQKMDEYFSEMILMDQFEYSMLLGEDEQFTEKLAQFILDKENFIIEKTYYEDDETGEPILRYYIKKEGEELSLSNLMFFIERPTSVEIEING